MKASLRPAFRDSPGGAANAFAYAGFPAYFGSLKTLARSHGPWPFGYTHRSDGAGSLGVGSNTRRIARRLPCLAHLVISPDSSHPLRGCGALPGAEGAGGTE